MGKDDLEVLWCSAIKDLLDSKIDDAILSVLAKQSYDSIRRIEIYKTYKLRAAQAVEGGRSYFETSNPFVLAQRSDLDTENRIWIVYLATYFGKSQKSSWELFNRAAFDLKRSLITTVQIKADIEKYFNYLESFDFFENSKFSNHRKYTKKSLGGRKGLFRSMEYVLENIKQYCNNDQIEFHEMYKRANQIPNFGRLASFDFSSSLVKCGFSIQEPQSMYARNSTGPLQALGFLLRLTDSDTAIQAQKNLSDDLVEWFNQNSNIFMVGQVLEDAICNWQKNPKKYIHYTG